MSRISTSEPIVTVENLSLTFNVASYRAWTLRDKWVELFKAPFGPASARKINVLDDVSFKIHHGDRVGLLGINGVGKTTLCRCLTGTYNPSRGSVIRRGRVRGVFDTGIGVYPELTGRENARLLMRFLYPDRRDHDALMEEALEFSELKDFLDSPFRVYSNGMQARLCLSLVSCLPSDLLILDEVFDGADHFFRAKIAKRILSVIEKSGAVVFVSHSAEQIEQVCNRVILIEDGRIAFDGDVAAGLAFYRHSEALQPRATPQNSPQP